MSVIVAEDLEVKAMIRKRQFAKSFADAAHGEVVRQLEYKMRWNGSLFIKTDPAYTSQDCSGCGKRHPEMRDLYIGTLRCECGTVLSRDRNAARNVLNRVLRSPEVIGRLETPVESGVQRTLETAPVQPLVEAGIGFVWLSPVTAESATVDRTIEIDPANMRRTGWDRCPRQR